MLCLGLTAVMLDLLLIDLVATIVMLATSTLSLDAKLLSFLASGFSSMSIILFKRPIGLSFKVVFVKLSSRFRLVFVFVLATTSSTSSTSLI